MRWLPLVLLVTPCAAACGGSTPTAPEASAATCARIETQTTSVNPRVGETVHVGAQAYDTANKTMTGAVVFTSSNPAVATVNAATGAVTAIGPGTVVITATCTSGGPPAPSAAVQITVRANPVTLVLQKAGTGDGFLTSSPAGTSFEAGSTVTVSVNPDAYSTFAGWGGACAGLGPCVVVMQPPGPITVRADLDPKIFTPVASPAIPTFVTTRAGVGCTWDVTVAPRVAFDFSVSVVENYWVNGTVRITGPLRARSRGGLCLDFETALNASVTLDGNINAMTFNGIIATPGSGNVYRAIFSGRLTGTTVTGTLRITYGGVDGSGQSATVTINAQ